jgi:outer membrane receptor protein involved in Fe transport
VHGETGLIKDLNTYPTAYTRLSKGATSLGSICRLTSEVATTNPCSPDALQSYNLFEDAQATPIGTGNRRLGGASLSGGSDALRYFTSAQVEDEIGIYQIPPFEINRLDSLGGTREEWLHPNRLGRQSMRANINATPNSKLDLGISTGFIHSTTRLPQTDNNALGLFSHAFGGPGFISNPTVGYANSSTGAQLYGYRASTPGDMFQNTTTQEINRFMGSGNANWRPTSWLANRANLGIDYTARQDQQLCRRGNCSDIGTTRLGFVRDDRASLNTFTADVGSTATWQPREWLNSKTTVGAQYVNNYFGRNGAGTQNLPPGTQTVSAGATPSSDQATEVSKTLGAFVEQAVAIRDRLFLTAAVRTDQNSAFGTKFQRVYYPKASLSYVISDESFFPKPAFLDEFRVRAAFGESGVQPGPNDALRYLTPQTYNIGSVDQPGVVFNAIGNDSLKPERAREYEMGVDTKLFGSRMSVELTYYSKTTMDALVSNIVPPSVGTQLTTVRQNLGSVKNAGVELAVNTQVIDNQSFGWNVGFTGSTNANKLVTLGAGIQPIVGATIRQQPGYPLNGYWQRAITSYEDLDKNGIISPNEVKVADSSSFRGSSVPLYEASLSNGFDLFNRMVRVNALIDYKGGNKLLNGTERIRCQNRNNCRGLFDRTASLFEQARVVALRDDASRTQEGYMEDASFVRFRELSVTATLPQVIASRLRASNASLTLAGRNLHKWTSYSGIDPESNADAGGGGTLSAPSDFQTSPPPTYFTVRLNLGF